MSVYHVKDFGANPNGEIVTDHIQQAIDSAHQAGGGKVVVPAGEFLTGALQLKDHIEFHLMAGAVLKFSDDPADYPVINSRIEGAEGEVLASCLYAEKAKNISVTGFGCLNGNGQKWWHIQRNNKESLTHGRPRLIGFDTCEEVTIKDIRMIDSPMWTVHPIKCYNVTIENVTIKNPADSPNTDGINPESCKNVRISNSNIDVGDDCIAIKAGTEETEERISCENITITNCTMVHGHGGVVIGSEMSGDIRNVTITNCIFQDTDRGIRLKSRRGRGGLVEDIRISNIVMDNVMCPFVINLYYYCGPLGKEKYVWDKNPYPITNETPHFRRIHFSNVTARNVQAAAGFIYGLAELYAAEITFSNVDISMAENAKPGRPAMMANIEDMTNRGFYVGFAKDLLFQHVTIENHVGPAFYLEATKDVEVIDCKSRHTKQPEELVERRELPKA